MVGKIIEKTIKTRISNQVLAELTDWRELVNIDESLESFNGRFSIWLYSFDRLEEKPDWKEQMISSVRMSQIWFSKADSEKWILDNTDYPALYILHADGKDEAVIARRKSRLDLPNVFCRSLMKAKPFATGSCMPITLLIA